MQTRADLMKNRKGRKGKGKIRKEEWRLERGRRGAWSSSVCDGVQTVVKGFVEIQRGNLRNAHLRAIKSSDRGFEKRHGQRGQLALVYCLRVCDMLLDAKLSAHEPFLL